jgi:cytidyltransferase-like protein
MNVVVSASFDNLRSRHVRFLQEAARLGDVHVLLWSDNVVERLEGRPPKFPQHERLYFVDAIRFVSKTSLVDGLFAAGELHDLPGTRFDIWAVEPAADTPALRQFCLDHKLACHAISNEQLRGFPLDPSGDIPAQPGRKKILATGCYDWLHTGHVRFFEEVSEYGDLYVAVGHDRNIELLKGPGHPQFRQDERAYMANSIKYVRQALITTGNGWLDAEPEIRRLKPDIYAVNEDGDKPEKREYCRQNGIEYLVLRRLPKPGLPRRQSTTLRGF